MSDKEKVATPETDSLDALEAMSLEELKAEKDSVDENISEILGMKKSTTENIVKAKGYQLDPERDSQRDLLKEILEKETNLLSYRRRLVSQIASIELRQSEEKCKEDLNMIEDPDLQSEIETRLSEEFLAKRSLAKSSRKSAKVCGAVAFLTGVIGLFGCLLGCIAYFYYLLTKGGEINWTWVIADGAVAALFVLIALSCRISARRKMKLANALEAEVADEEARIEIELRMIAAVYDIELATAVKKDKKPSKIKAFFAKFAKIKDFKGFRIFRKSNFTRENLSNTVKTVKEKTVETVTKAKEKTTVAVKKHWKTLTPVAAACVAVTATVMAFKTKKKQSK